MRATARVAQKKEKKKRPQHHNPGLVARVRACSQIKHAPVNFMGPHPWKICFRNRPSTSPRGQNKCTPLLENELLGVSVAACLKKRASTWRWHFYLKRRETESVLIRQLGGMHDRTFIFSHNSLLYIVLNIGSSSLMLKETLAYGNELLISQDRWTASPPKEEKIPIHYLLPPARRCVQNALCLECIVLQVIVLSWSDVFSLLCLCSVVFGMHCQWLINSEHNRPKGQYTDPGCIVFGIHCLCCVRNALCFEWIIS